MSFKDIQEFIQNSTQEEIRHAADSLVRAIQANYLDCENFIGSTTSLLDLAQLKIVLEERVKKLEMIGEDSLKGVRV